jgi:hypothetical protein
MSKRGASRRGPESRAAGSHPRAGLSAFRQICSTSSTPTPASYRRAAWCLVAEQGPADRIRDDILNGLVDSAREPLTEAFPFVFVLARGGCDCPRDPLVAAGVRFVRLRRTPHAENAAPRQGLLVTVRSVWVAVVGLQPGSLRVNALPWYPAGFSSSRQRDDTGWLT